MTDVTRRTVLVGGAATGLALAGGAALSGCGSSTPSTGQRTSGTSGSGGTGEAAAAEQPLAKLVDIPVGQAVSAQLAGKPVIVARPTADTVAAFSAICTHQGCTVAPAGAELHCPCHGSVYNATTGAVKHGPAPRALASVPVKIRNGDVVPA